MTASKSPDVELEEYLSAKDSGKGTDNVNILYYWENETHVL